MSIPAQPAPPVPFPLDYRASGVLLPVTSLPSPYGVGDLGPSAYAWIDRLHEAGQTWWQALPLGPTGYGNSPYQSLSSFAANGLLISPELLVSDGLLHGSACEGETFSSTSVDYGPAAQFKLRLLNQTWSHFKVGFRKDMKPAYEEFCYMQAHWLEDYALFRALKEKYYSMSYLEWPEGLVRRSPAAMMEARKELSQQIDKVRLTQFLIFQQARQLKEYANAKGIRLIGDLPFYVSPDSCDVWAHGELFLLDDNCRPRFVGGVPPDYFSAEGQLWGNPVYDWDALRRTGFRFFLERLRALLALVDVVRLDHFRAFAEAWHVPVDSRTARTGQFIPGPGAEFFSAVKEELGALPFIAEDLGLITPDVYALRDEFRIPGTRVLQFAFDGSAENPHLPANYSTNTVVYTGTHDNDTTRGWFESLPEAERPKVWRCLNRTEGDAREVADELLSAAWSSVAALAIVPFQDLLNLGSEARMNLPGTAEGNWRWRATEDMLTATVFEHVKDLTANTNRLRLAQGSAVAAAARSGM
jgi:4-alpha-glucanotransferase